MITAQLLIPWLQTRTLRFKANIRPVSKLI